MMWITVIDSSETKPKTLDTTSSHVVNYLRKNIRRVNETGEDGNATEFWQYEQLRIPKTTWAVIEAAMLVNEDTNAKADENTENISINSDGIDDLAETTDVSASAIDDLAGYVAGLEERIAELEAKITESEG